MALYPKKLYSLKDIEREKKLLKKEMERMDKDESLSVNGLLGKKGGKKDKDGGFTASSLIDMLPISSPVTMGLLKLVTDRVLKRKENKREEYNAVYYGEPKPKKHPIRNAAVEVLGGYLKWKAVELSVKGVKHLIQKRKEKKAYEASLQFPSRKID